MGSRTLIVTFLLGQLAVSARAELQLVPTISTYDLDGATFAQLSFPDGAKKVTYQPPRRWTWNGSSNQLVLHPPNDSRAEVTISRQELGLPGPGAPDDIAKLAEQVTASLPEGATNVSVIKQEQSALQIGSKPASLVVVKYDSFGQHYIRSELLLRRADDQIRFRLISLANEFEPLQAAFLASQYSWQNL